MAQLNALYLLQPKSTNERKTINIKASSKYVVLLLSSALITFTFCEYLSNIQAKAATPAKWHR
jgi:hypothetical protein